MNKSLIEGRFPSIAIRLCDAHRGRLPFSAVGRNARKPLKMDGLWFCCAATEIFFPMPRKSGKFEAGCTRNAAKNGKI
jgi:hypothetical protein